MATHHKYQLAILGGILIHSRHAKHLTTAELVDIADTLEIDMVELVNLYQQRI